MQQEKFLIALWTKSFLELKAKSSFYFKWKSSNTNDLAKKKAFTKHFSLPIFCLSVKQSRGRGFGNKKWENSDLMLSVLWESAGLKIDPKACKSLVWDLKKALEQTWPELLPTLKVKAPNDLYLKEAKLAGLLLEVLKQGSKTALILGLGLNVFQSPSHLPATYLSSVTKKIDQKSWLNFLELLITLWSKRVGTYST